MRGRQLKRVFSSMQRLGNTPGCPLALLSYTPYLLFHDFTHLVERIYIHGVQVPVSQLKENITVFHLVFKIMARAFSGLF